MTLPLLYSNNAEIKYPLDEFHEEPIPDSILLDMSLTVAEGVDPVVAAIRVGAGFVFVSVEERTTGVPVGSAIVQSPLTGIVYPLTMDNGGFGWVVFGPGSIFGNEFFSSDVEVGIDPECITRLKPTANPFELSVNGFSKEIANVLSIASFNSLLTITVDGNTIYIDRNDDGLDDTDLAAFSNDTDPLAAVENNVLFTIDGVSPDDDGNIDIDIEGCVDDCSDERSLEVPRGDTSQGVQGELPLDIFTERTYAPGDPCDPDAESSSAAEASSSPDPFEGCTEIVKRDILDASNGDKAVGTLYTVDR
jgi:hypothetical protein